MKLKNPLLVVRDMAESVAFYREVLSLRVTMGFGANVTLTDSGMSPRQLAERMDVPLKLVNASMK